MPNRSSAHEALEQADASTRQRFREEKRVLSFEAYLDEFLKHPWRHSRDAARYLRDCFDFYGHEEVDQPWGKTRRYKLFDQPFLDEQADQNEQDEHDEHDEQDGPQRWRLVGHERLQQDCYRALSNFAREGRANRLLLLHGPNGSAKSTFAACVMRALEHFSTVEEGALYRFAWVFARGGDDKAIGFGASGRRGGEPTTFAHLEHERIGAKLTSELREHPLLLLPLEERRSLVRDAFRRAGIDDEPPDWIWNGRLGRKNAAVFDALLASYGGDLNKVLAHVQVERYAVSRRYRAGAVTIGPQMSVDAGERQITADRSLHELPGVLASLNLFETFGELVDGQGGLIEYSDLLKRPLEAWKYLLLAIEAGEVALTQSLLTINAVLLASTNEVHLAAFRQHPEYNSFRARVQPLRVGYLLDYRREQRIYDSQIVPQIRRHVAPHATEMAALWAVLTRLEPSDAEHHEDDALGRIAASLTAMEKARLYADGDLPRRLDADDTAVLRAGLEQVAREYEARADYEGREGASPREVRGLLLDAAQHPVHECLSVLAVVDQAQALCEQGDYDFLQRKPDGGFYDARGFVALVRELWIGIFDTEARASTGLVEEARHGELFARYVTHVSLWVKGERYQDPHTGAAADPDENLMKQVEEALEVTESDDFRRHMISTIAADAIDHPDQEVDYARIFPRHLEALRESYFGTHREQVAQALGQVLAVLEDTKEGLDADALTRARAVIEKLHAFGYCDACARSSLGALLRERYTVAAS